MKILHISTMTEGGAGLCAKRIHHALIENRIESMMLIAKGEESDASIAVAKQDTDYWYSNIFSGKLKHLFMRLNILKDKEYWDNKISEENADLPTNVYISHPFSNYKNLVNHPLVSHADIIHLHWVTGFVDYPSFFVNLKKPIIWTLHDENLGHGLFHLKSAKNGIPESLKKLDESIKKIKHNCLSKAESIHLVAISETMKCFIQEDDFLRRFPVTLIHNGIEPNAFKLLNKDECRKQLKLPMNNTIFLFSAHNIQDINKGLEKLLDALAQSNDNYVTLVCLGDYTTRPFTTIDVRYVGRVSNEELLSSYYSAADYYVMSSQQESFSQTIVESMACGTPVIAFPTGIVPELITERNGIKCEDFTVEALTNGIVRAKRKHFDREDLRSQVIEEFNYHDIAKQYVKLYESLLTK